MEKIVMPTQFKQDFPNIAEIFEEHPEVLEKILDSYRNQISDKQLQRIYYERFQKEKDEMLLAHIKQLPLEKMKEDYAFLYEVGLLFAQKIKKESKD